MFAHEPFSAEGDPFPLVSQTLTPVCELVALISQPVSFIGHAFAFSSDEVTTVRQPCSFVHIGGRMDLLGGDASIGRRCPLRRPRRDPPRTLLRSKQFRLCPFNGRLSPFDRCSSRCLISNFVGIGSRLTLNLAVQRPFVFVRKSFTLIGKSFTLIC